MKIERAIEILKERVRIGDPLKNEAYEDALKLGIEALREIQYLHVSQVLDEDELLQGETKD